MSYFASSTEASGEGRGGDQVSSGLDLFDWSAGCFLSRVKKLFFWSPRLRTFIHAILPRLSWRVSHLCFLTLCVRACGCLLGRPSEVEGTNVHTGTVVKAKLNLIDLAGSERISKTDATGDRLRWGASFH